MLERLLVASLALLLVAPALAGEAEQVALEAHGAHAAGCADVAGDQVGRTADAMVVVATVYGRVHETYEAAPEPKPGFLLYWRGVLGQCLGRTNLAGADLKAFVEAERDNSRFRTQVRDARRRLRSLGLSVSPNSELRAEADAGVGEHKPPPQPRFTLDASGGFHRVQGAVAGWTYGLGGLQFSVRLQGPLAVGVGGTVGVTGPIRNGLGDVVLDDGGHEQRSLLLLARAGAVLRGPGAIRPQLALLFQVGPDPLGVFGAPVVVGAVVQGGIELGLGPAPVALFVRGEIGFLSASLQAGGVAGIQLAVP